MMKLIWWLFVQLIIIIMNILKKALEHNKHCLCEKPFMENSQQAKEVFALAKEKGPYCSAIKIEDMIVIF